LKTNFTFRTAYFSKVKIVTDCEFLRLTFDGTLIIGHGSVDTRRPMRMRNTVGLWMTALPPSSHLECDEKRQLRREGSACCSSCSLGRRRRLAARPSLHWPACLDAWPVLPVVGQEDGQSSPALQPAQPDRTAAGMDLGVSISCYLSARSLRSAALPASWRRRLAVERVCATLCRRAELHNVHDSDSYRGDLVGG
jgi:hypothetical protein